MSWMKERREKERAYEEKYNIQVVCKREHEPEILGSYTRVSGRLTGPTTEPQITEEFRRVGAGYVATPLEEYTRRHDTGLYSRQLTHDGEEPLTQDESRRRPTRDHHQLLCPKCGWKRSLRDETIQRLLKDLHGRTTLLTSETLDLWLREYNGVD